MSSKHDHTTARSVSFDQVKEAHHRITNLVHQTPVLTSTQLDHLAGAHLFFKCENFQRAGAFKFRGACNALIQLKARVSDARVLAYSSGNHAQAVALASSLFEIPATLVMPENAPSTKADAVRHYIKNTPSTLIQYDPQQVQREQLAQKIAEEQSLTIIPPYDHPDIIAGQGTAALELFEQVQHLDALFVPCGGGGLLAGCAIVASTLCSNCRVIGVEPALADDATRTFHTGKLHTVHNPPTIADGARTPSLGQFTRPIILDLVHDMVTVTDDQLRHAMHLVMQRMKTIIEPTAALPVAAALARLGIDDLPADARIGLLISGGNIDLPLLNTLTQSTP